MKSVETQTDSQWRKIEHRAESEQRGHNTFSRQKRSQKNEDDAVEHAKAAQDLADVRSDLREDI